MLQNKKLEWREFYMFAVKLVKSSIILQRSIEIPVISRFCVHSQKWGKIIGGQELKKKSVLLYITK